MAKKVVIIGDTHFPYTNHEALKKVYEVVRIEKPDVIVQIGDLLDQYTFSHFPRNANYTPQNDVTRGLECAKKFWKKLQTISPNSKCIQILGNHDVRMSKRIAERVPELEEFYSIKQLYRFEDVKVMKSDRDYFEYDGVVYCHGWLSNSLSHAKYFNKPTVHGHRHRPTVETDGKIWSMDVGHLANEKSIPMSYTASRFTKWRMAVGIVEDRKPHLILL